MSNTRTFEDFYAAYVENQRKLDQLPPDVQAARKLIKMGDEDRAIRRELGFTAYPVVYHHNGAMEYRSLDTDEPLSANETWLELQRIDASREIQSERRPRVNFDDVKENNNE